MASSSSASSTSSTSFPRTPIIVTTAEPEGSDLVRDVTALGIAALVRKPWKPHELKAVIDEVVA